MNWPHRRIIGTAAFAMVCLTVGLMHSQPCVMDNHLARGIKAFFGKHCE